MTDELAQAVVIVALGIMVFSFFFRRKDDQP